MTDYYQEMRDACATIVKTAAKACGENHERLDYMSFEHLLGMAKWASLGKDEAMEASKDAIAKGVGDAMLKAIEKDLA